MKRGMIAIVLGWIPFLAQAQMSPEEQLKFQMDSLAIEMINHFGRFDYEEARECAEKIIKLSPDGVENYRQSQSVLNDELAGVGWKPEPHPDELYSASSDGDFWARAKASYEKKTKLLSQEIEGLSVDEKIESLVERLDEAFLESPFIGGRSTDSIIASLVELGDPAVPALIEVLENDERLIRDLKGGPAGPVRINTARDAAHLALWGIIKINADPLTHSAPWRAEKVRAFWDEYGDLPFDARMMKILRTEPEWREKAAKNLAMLGLSDEAKYAERRPSGAENPAIAKFENPTVAEAILKAMHDDIALLGEEPLDLRFRSGSINEQIDHAREMRESDVESVRSRYLGYLEILGDARIVPELRKVFDRFEDLEKKLEVGETISNLNDDSIARSYAYQIIEGNITDLSNYWSIMRYLGGAHPTIRDDVLAAIISDENHPLRELLFLRGTSGGTTSKPSLKFIMSFLDDRRKISKEDLKRTHCFSQELEQSNILEYRHLAASQLDSLIFGCSFLSPESEDYEAQFTKSREWLDNHFDVLRLFSDGELEVGNDSDEVTKIGSWVVDYEVSEEALETDPRLPFFARFVGNPDRSESLVLVTDAKLGEGAVFPTLHGCSLENGFSTFRSIDVADVMPVSSAAAATKPQSPGGLTGYKLAGGFGRFTKGGAGGKVLFVENLNDAGPGSLRAALEADGPRMVLFRVAGNIKLESPIEVTNPFLTIAGESGPGEGICIKGAGVVIRTHDVIVRFIRIRPGTEAVAGAPALSVVDSKNIVVDRCSLSWTHGSVVSISNSEDLTMQWCIVSESFEIPDHAGEGIGLSVSGGKNISLHQNLIAHHRTAGLKLADGGRDSGVIDVRQNYFYNWGETAIDGNVLGRMNLVGNSFVAGNATPRMPTLFKFTESEAAARYFIAENTVICSSKTTGDEWWGVNLPESMQREELVSHYEFRFERMSREPAASARFEKSHWRDTDERSESLPYIGTVVPRRDLIDARITKQSRWNLIEEGDGIITSEADVGGWPDLKTGGVSEVDSDSDGIPDEWAKAYRLGAENPEDGNNGGEKGMTMLEAYLMSLIEQKVPE